MRIYKNKSFARFARRNDLADSDICRAVQDANRGLFSADLECDDKDKTVS